ANRADVSAWLHQVQATRHLQCREVAFANPGVVEVGNALDRPAREGCISLDEYDFDLRIEQRNHESVILQSRAHDGYGIDQARCARETIGCLPAMTFCKESVS